MYSCVNTLFIVTEVFAEQGETSVMSILIVYFEAKLHLVEKKKDIKSAISAIEKVEDANMKLELYRQLGKDLTDGI